VKSLFFPLVLICPWMAVAATEEIPSGDSRSASINPGAIQTWAFTVQKGQTTYLHVAAISGAPFNPTIQVLDPLNVPGVSDTGNQTAATYFTATMSGTYTVRVADTAIQDGATSYRIFHTTAPGPQVVPAGDEGGKLGNGGTTSGTITPGDIDVWTFQANANEEILLRLTEPGPSGLQPELILFDADGSILTNQFSAGDAASLVHRPKMGGPFTVVVRDGSPHGAGSGAYQLSLARSAGEFVVPAGDEGGALTNGANHDGVITPGDMDMWTFHASSGEEIFLNVNKTDTSTLAPYLRVYSPEGQPLSASAYSAGDFRLTAPEGGRYTVLVSDGNLSSSGNYSLAFLRAGAEFVVAAGDEGGALLNGGKYAGMIGVGETDAWSFQAKAGEQLLIRASEPVDSPFTPHLELFGPDGRRVAFYAGGPSSTSLEYLTKEPGRYVVTVRDRGITTSASGSYDLYFSQSAAPAIVPAGDEGGPLENGANYSGSIPRGDIDTWTFEGGAGQQLLVAIIAPPPSALTPLLRVFGPKGEMLWENNAGVQLKLPESGHYALVVADAQKDASRSGDYRMAFYLGGNPCAIPEGDEGGPLPIGRTQQAATSNGDMDFWTIGAKANEVLRLKAFKSDNSNFVANISIYGPAGEFVTGASSVASSGSATVYWIPATSGTYTVVTTDANRKSGETCQYFIQCSGLLPDGDVFVEDEGGVLMPGDHDGSIPIGDLDPWVFDAVAGDQVTLSLMRRGSMTLYPHLLVQAPDGLAFHHAIYDSNHTLTVGQTGRYTAWVSDLSYGGGDYRLSYARIPGSAGIPTGTLQGAMESGGRYSGTLATGSAHLWTFSAEEGQRIMLRATDSSATGTPRLRVTGPDGIRVAEASHADLATTDFTCAAAGTFTVAVDDREGAASEYFLDLAKTTGPFIIPAGDQGGSIGSGSEVTATLTPGDLDFWSFSANAGERVRLHLTETVAEGVLATLTPYLRVYAPDGSLLAIATQSDFAATALTARVEFDCETSGTYLVCAAKTDHRAGNYTLRMVKHGGDYVVSPGDGGGQLTSGSEVTASLPGGDVDLWHFKAAQGQKFSFHVHNTGTLLQPAVRVFAPDGRLVSDRWAYTNAMTDITCDTAGDYLIEIRDEAKRQGSYRISFFDVTGNFITPQGDQGGEITNSSPGRGSARAGDVDLWTFQAIAGEPVRLQVTSPADMRVFSPSGLVLAGAENLPEARSLGFRCAETGTYTVVIYTYSTFSIPGDYSCHLARSFGEAVAPVGDEGGLFPSGAELPGSLANDDLDLWHIEARSGDILDVRLRTVNSNLSFYPRIYRPDGSLMWAPVTTESGINSRFACDETGRYAIELRPREGFSGSYVLHAASSRGPYAPAAPDDEGGTMSAGTVHTGTLVPGEVDLWSFPAAGGEGVTLDSPNPDASPYSELAVYRPDGSLIATTEYYAWERISFQADAPGIYRVVINTRGSNASNPYSLRLNLKPGGFFPPASGSGGFLNAGIPQTTILANGASDFWRFRAKAGDSLVLQLIATGGSSGFSPQLHLYGPDGVLLASGPALDLQAPASGYYYLRVEDADPGGGTGQYQVEVSGNTERLLEPAMTVSGPGRLTLSWPSWPAASLWQSSGLNASNWQAAPAAQDDGYFKHVEIDTQGASRKFFRLTGN
jgi:hypothetical protein